MSSPVHLLWVCTEPAFQNGALMFLIVLVLDGIFLVQVAPGVFEYVPSPVDEEVKVSVIRDTLRLMDPSYKNPSA